jgi:hypothetical protein
MFSKISRARSLASHFGHGEECLRGHVVFTSEFLENLEELLGREVQESESSVNMQNIN